MPDDNACLWANPDKPTSGYYRHRRGGEQPCDECTALLTGRVHANEKARNGGRRSPHPKKHLIVCEHCGAEAMGRHAATRFCSPACAHASTRKTSRELVVWQPPVVRAPGPRWRRRPVKFPPLFGSLFVYGACQWCGDDFMAPAADWERRALYCSKRCAKNASNHRRGRFVIPRHRRLAIYERDGWTCQLCLEPVDPDVTDEWRATLDHIVPQSHQLIPDHSDRNLRLAHLWCNSVRGDESYYTAADLLIAS